MVFLKNSTVILKNAAGKFLTSSAAVPATPHLRDCRENRRQPVAGGAVGRVPVVWHDVLERKVGGMDNEAA